MGVAITLWRKPIARAEARKNTPPRRRPSLTSLLSSFQSGETSDKSPAATMAARFGSPLIVWMGAVFARVTEGALAASVGAGVRG